MNRTDFTREQRLTLWQALSRLVGQYPAAFVVLLFVTAAQSAVNAMSVIVIAPIVDVLFQPEGASPNALTEWLNQAVVALGLNLDIETLFFVFGLTLVLGGFLGVLTKFLVLKIKYRVLEDLLASTLRHFLPLATSFLVTERLANF